jgi:hypothetical protein
MIINLVLDAAAQGAPLAVRNIWQQAANMIASMCTDNITVNLNVDYSGTGGGASAGPSGSLLESYSSIYADLRNGAVPGDSSFDALPVPGAANAPANVVVWNAELKALGLLAGNAPGIDGSVHFSTDISQSLLLGVALHEFGHAMGRVPSSSPDIWELTRFSSAGNRVYDGGVPAAEASYFSLNGGVSKWADYGVHSDPSDTMNNYVFSGDGPSPLSPEDPYNQFYDSNTLQYMTPLDLEIMDILGFHPKADSPAANAYDFNGQNSGDILLQNAGGQIEYANMAGGSFQGIVQVANTPGWNVVGQGKISGGVDSNFVIQNGGQIDYGNLVNGVLSNFVYVCNVPGWNVVAVGDVNGDYHADILIQNPTSGAVDYINMANGQFTNFYGLPSTPGWKAVALADIANNGFDDIVIQKISTGEITCENMTNGVFNNWVEVTGTPGYNVVGAGEITRSGFDNIVIQNPNSGDIDFANMNGGVFNNWVDIGSVPGWNVIGVEDVLGNGYADIVIQNGSSGQIEYANMTGGIFQGWVNITTPPSGFVGKTGPGPSASASATPDLGAPGSGMAAGAAMQDSGSQNDGTAPGVFAQDPGPSDAGTVNGMSMFDPAALHGGALSAVSLFDPGLSNGSEVAGAGVNDHGSASWLTDGALPGGTSIGSNQVISSGVLGTPVVTADGNLQHALKLGT